MAATTTPATLADALATGMVLYEHRSPAQGWAVVTDAGRIETLVSLASGRPRTPNREAVEVALLAGRQVHYGAPDCWYAEIALRPSVPQAPATTAPATTCNRCGGPVSVGRGVCGEC